MNHFQVNYGFSGELFSGDYTKVFPKIKFSSYGVAQLNGTPAISNVGHRDWWLIYNYWNIGT